MTVPIAIPQDYEPILRLVGARTGLCFDSSLRENAVATVRKAIDRLGPGDVHGYYMLLQADRGALDNLIEELTVGETYFFRHEEQFEFVRRRVLPTVLAHKSPGEVIRAWSAGCASGEEAYSLAIVFDQQGLSARTHILATDISIAALTRAREAVYRQWSLRGTGAREAAPYLCQSADSYVLDERIRRQVTFEPLNLALDLYPSFATGTWGKDLIFCRNVLIYLDRECVERVARRLYESLVPGGWLITAASDPPLAEFAPFETTADEAGVYSRPQVVPPAVSRQDIGALPPGPDEVRPRSTVVPVANHEITRENGRAGEKRPGEWKRKPDSPAPGKPSRASIFEVCSPPRAADGTDDAALHLAARDALLQGDYHQAVRLTSSRFDNPALCALHVRAVANLEVGEAARLCEKALARHPLSAELHYLHAVLLVELGRDDQAAQAARRVIYLDRSLAVAHFTLGTVLVRQGDLNGARRAFRNAQTLCAAQATDEPVPLTDGEPAGRLAAAAMAQIKLLDHALKTGT